MTPVRIFIAGWAMLFIVEAVGAITPTPPPEATPTACILLGGEGAINDVRIEPATPTVGDSTKIHFRIDFLGYSRDQVRIEGGGNLLDGNRSVFSGPFEMLAVAAGRATIELVFNYRTEYRCGDIYYPGPNMEARSQALTFEIVEPTATPTPTIEPSPDSCAGDCDSDGAVTIHELVQGVGIATGRMPATQCPETDRDGDGRVTVAELVTAVRAALYGCASESLR